MIRKILCWFGFHEWWSKRFFGDENFIVWCKHCGKEKEQNNDQ